jgi:hypothetical protein
MKRYHTQVQVPAPWFSGDPRGMNSFGVFALSEIKQYFTSLVSGEIMEFPRHHNNILNSNISEIRTVFRLQFHGYVQKSDQTRFMEYLPA